MLEERARKGCVLEDGSGAKAKVSASLEEAIGLYRRAKNWQQAAQLMLELGQQDEAAQICLDSKDSAASLLVSTFFHRKGEVEKAIKMLIECGCTSHAIQ